MKVGVITNLRTYVRSRESESEGQGRVRVSESNCEGESEGQRKGKGEIACASVCVGVCARVRAVRRTQGLTNNFEAMLTEASRADEQGQTLLHIIAWRKGRSPHSDQQCPERSSPRSGVAFLPSLHHETPGLSAASRPWLTRPFFLTRLRPLSCSLRAYVHTYVRT